MSFTLVLRACALMLGTCAIDAFAEATGEKKPKLLFDLEAALSAVETSSGWTPPETSSAATTRSPCRAASLEARFELRPAPKRLGVYVYAGGGYEMPFSDTRETARATASLPGIRRDLEFEVFGSAEVRHTWFLEAGIGWRFRAPF
jgi:hypothetical protein